MKQASTAHCMLPKYKSTLWPTNKHPPNLETNQNTVYST